MSLLGDGWRAARDRLVGNPAFRRWAAAFPLTRPIARRRARDVFDLCAGFVYSQVLLAAVRLDLFTHLSTPLTARELSLRTAVPPESLARLLEAMVALRLAEGRGGGRYGLGTLGGPLIGNGGVAAMVEHNALFYDDLRDPLALLRGTTKASLATYWAYTEAVTPAACTPEQVRGYSGLMAASQVLVAEDVLESYPFGHHRSVLDVGGGDGAFLRAIAPRHPALHLMLFDLPAVAALARAGCEAAGLGHRSEFFGGDFFRDPLPPGADAITFVRVLHDHDDAAAGGLLASAYRALAPGGRVVIAEPMAGESGRVGAAYFALYFLALGSGRPRSPGEYRRMLERAGFGSARQLRTHNPVQCSLVVGTR